MQIPESMKAQLGAWNSGKGIDLVSWVGCQGSFSLAVGYSTIFWPGFVGYNGYILREGFSKSALEDFEVQNKGNRQAVEAVMNHLHIAMGWTPPHLDGIDVPNWSCHKPVKCERSPP